MVFKTNYSLRQVKRIAECEHSVILSAFTKLPFVFKIFDLSIFEWPFYTGLGCCPFLGGGSVVVVNLLFKAFPIVCLCFVMHYFVSILVLQSSLRGREEKAGCFAIIVLQVYCCYKFAVALPHGAVGWSAVCGCGISWSYSLTFLL